MNTLTEKERQAIIKVLQKCEILDEIDIVCSEIQESLAELRKEEAPSEGKLLTPDVNAETVTKKEMFDFAAWMLWTFDTDLISLAKTMSELYEEFKTNQPK